MWYHFAFVAISIALFGMTAGALLAYAWQPRFQSGLFKTYLARAALAYPVSLVFRFPPHLSVPLLMHPSVVAAYAIAFTIVVISVPFIISGICVSLTLT